MTGICGWAGEGRHPASSQVIQCMAAALAKGENSRVCMASGVAGAVAISGQGKHAHTYSRGDLLIAISGHPRLDDALLGRLEKESGVAHAIAEGYVLRGTRVLESVLGTFALAIVDSARGEALLAVDRMGVQPLCYATHAGRLVFGSTLDALSAFPGIGRKVDLQAIYDFVHFHMIPAPATVYADRRRLLPGTYLHWSNDAVRTAPYWEMRFIEDDVRPFPELKEQFVTLVRHSVARAAEDGEPGSFLSGGTDSSTVAGMLGEVRGEPARTYSIGFRAEGYDESSFAQVAAKHFGTRHREYYVTPDDVVDAIPRIASAHDQPFGNSSAVPTFYCAKLAREDGVSTLLGGDGGDELFGGNARYATQYVYSLYSDLPPLVRKAAIEPVAAFFPAVGVFGKARRYMSTASLPMPQRYDNYNLLDRLGADTLFTSDFLAAVDRGAPALQFKQAYCASNAQSLINRMLALDLKYTLADNDLPKVSRSCALAGVDVRYPMLDDELVAFSARLPPKHKLRGTQLRHFFKKALADFLPEEVIRKTKHGFGLPFGTWLQSHSGLQRIAFDSVAQLKQRRVLRPQFVDELLGMHLQQHPQYYGTLVWVLMMLEQWLKQQHINLS